MKITLLKIWGHFPVEKEKEEWNKNEVLEVTHENRENKNSRDQI